MRCKDWYFTEGIWVVIRDNTCLYNMYLPYYGYKVFTVLKMDYNKDTYTHVINEKRLINKPPKITLFAQSLSKLGGQLINAHIRIL